MSSKQMGAPDVATETAVFVVKSSCSENVGIANKMEGCMGAKQEAASRRLEPPLYAQESSSTEVLKDTL